MILLDFDVLFEIIDDLSFSFEFFFSDFLLKLLDFVEFTPLVLFSVLVFFVVPLFIHVIDIFIMFSDSTAKLTFDNKEGIQNVITKTDKTVSKVRRQLLKKKRDEALEAQRASRGRSPSNNNKYVNAYISSLKYDNK